MSSGQEGDILRVNLESVSKELNELVSAADKEASAYSQRIDVAMRQTLPNKNIPNKCSQREEIFCLANLWNQQQYYANIGLQRTLETNLPTYNKWVPPESTYSNYLMEPHVFKKWTTPCHIATLSNSVAAAIPYPTVLYLTTCDCGVTENAPIYEVHNLHPRIVMTDIGNVLPPNAENQTVLNSSSKGAHRKYCINKVQRTKLALNVLDCNRVIVDFSVFGWYNNDKDLNQVLRLFILFRDLHNAIDEISPNIYHSASVFEDVFATRLIANMPCTMNIQYQVKQAARKCNIFVREMKNILYDNQKYDDQLHAECEAYLKRLRQLLLNFDTYKRIELVHKKGQFVNDNITAQAKNLELLMQNIIQFIRKVRIQFLAYNWFITVKYRARNGPLNKIQDSDFKYNKNVKRSKFGVINEILQLCNMRINQIGFTITSNENHPFM